MNRNKLYVFSLVFAFITIWILMVKAKYAEYDSNYGYAIYALLVSLGITFGILVLWFKIRQLLENNSAVTIFFLLTSSPLSIYFFIYLYGGVVGQYFRL